MYSYVGKKKKFLISLFLYGIYCFLLIASSLYLSSLFCKVYFSVILFLEYASTKFSLVRVNYTIVTLYKIHFRKEIHIGKFNVVL